MKPTETPIPTTTATTTESTTFSLGEHLMLQNSLQKSCRLLCIDDVNQTLTIMPLFEPISAPATSFDLSVSIVRHNKRRTKTNIVDVSALDSSTLDVLLLSINSSSSSSSLISTLSFGAAIQSKKNDIKSWFALNGNIVSIDFQELFSRRTGFIDVARIDTTMDVANAEHVGLFARVAVAFREQTIGVSAKSNQLYGVGRASSAVESLSSSSTSSMSAFGVRLRHHLNSTPLKTTSAGEDDDDEQRLSIRVCISPPHCNVFLPSDSKLLFKN